MSVKKDWIMELGPQSGADSLLEKRLHSTYAVDNSSDTQTTGEVDKKLHLDLERYRALIAASFQMTWTLNADGMANEDFPEWRAYVYPTAP